MRQTCYVHIILLLSSQHSRPCFQFHSEGVWLGLKFVDEYRISREQRNTEEIDGQFSHMKRTSISISGEIATQGYRRKQLLKNHILHITFDSWPLTLVGVFPQSTISPVHWTPTGTLSFSLILALFTWR